MTFRSVSSAHLQQQLQPFIGGVSPETAFLAAYNLPFSIHQKHSGRIFGAQLSTQFSTLFTNHNGPILLTNLLCVAFSNANLLYRGNSKVISDFGPNVWALAIELPDLFVGVFQDEQHL